MEPSSEERVNRRDLFRLAGAGAVTVFAPSFGVASGLNPAKPEEKLAPTCWEQVNHLDRGQSEQLRKRMAWWHEAKFGMFIHWGPCSLASVEISWPIMVPEARWHITQEEYVNLYKRFNPTQYDPKAWIELAKAAGQRYMVFTSKHHDGFCNFDSSFTDYKITNTPYKKDIVQMLVDACREENMPLGFYYSPPDMHHSGYRDISRPVRDTWRGEPTRPGWAGYLNYMEGQLRELLTQYGPVAVIWFDGLEHPEKYDGQRFLKLIHELQPATLVNNRIGLPGDFATPEQAIPDRIPTRSAAQGSEDIEAPQGPGPAPASRDFQLWETCMTINNTWAYNKNDRHFKSVQELIRDLVNVASKGGNFLLDVGPTSEGTIQPEFVERLQAIGKWMKVNGDSIYGTTYGPWQNLRFGKTTAKGHTVYLHVFTWPSKPQLDLPGLGAAVRQITVLATGRKVQFQQAKGRLTIAVPPRAPDPDDSVFEIDTR